MKKKIDIIWNITSICPWDCAICCVDAVHVSRGKGEILIRSNSLSTQEIIAKEANSDTFEAVHKFRTAQKLELSYENKLKILDNLYGFNTKIDFSGGDPLILKENFEILKEASKKFGKENITLTATGASLSKYDPAEIAKYVGELNFTYDNNDLVNNLNRPKGYAKGNLKYAKIFSKLGVSTRAELPLTMENCNLDLVRSMYVTLNKVGITKILLMRYFPVGRGMNKKQESPTSDNYREVIDLLRQLEKEYKFPMLKIQCALKYFDTPQELKENPCDLFVESFGLMANGNLLASPWAINSHGNPLDDSFLLGNLRENSFSSIIEQPKSKIYLQRSHENFGHCKIFSFLFSMKENVFDRIFDNSDPLIS